MKHTRGPGAALLSMTHRTALPAHNCKFFSCSQLVPGTLLQKILTIQRNSNK